MFEQIVTHFNEQIDIASVNTEDLTPYIAEAGTLITQKLTQGSVFIACDSDTFSSGHELNRQLLQLDTAEHPSLPSTFLNLNTLGLQGSQDQCLSSQLAHLASPNDILIAFTSSSPNKTIEHCLNEAQAMSLPTLLITPANNPLLQSLTQTDSAIPLPLVAKTAELQLHFSLAILLSTLIQTSLFGQSFT